MIFFSLPVSIRRNPLYLLSVLLFMLGVGLLTTAGSTRLICDRDVDNRVQCKLKQTFSLGIIPKSSQIITDVTSVKLDQQVRQIYEKSSEGENPTGRERDAYGILLVGDQQVLINSYEYNRDRQEQRLQKISAFLTNTDQLQLKLDIKNFWSSIFTLLTFGGAAALFLISRRK